MWLLNSKNTRMRAICAVLLRRMGLLAVEFLFGRAGIRRQHDEVAGICALLRIG